MYETNCKKIAQFKKSAENEIHTSEISLENHVTLSVFGKVTTYLCNQINKNSALKKKPHVKKKV